ncbi:Late embryogenesis abundant protein [Carex littledalei]|uniref:Late embryogenesis abundant protein n=1 Tax=Carex littledalei TaxID=544730 RepID=A0A833VJ26_9POAL|nr:Late embryogenesis abundant protein [Carex littledalei]
MAIASAHLKHGKFAKALPALQNGSLLSSLISVRRGAHTSSNNYSGSDTDEVNLDCDGIHEALNQKPIEEHENNAKTVAPVLPDKVIESETENFWAPDPETGVFVPAEESEIDVNNSRPAPPHPTENGTSVLDQTVWVREVEIEEVERPTPSIAGEPPTNVKEQ